MILMIALAGWRSGHAHGPARGPCSGRDGETARRILDRRYASGEITGEKYEGMRLDIDSG